MSSRGPAQQVFPEDFPCGQKLNDRATLVYCLTSNPLTFPGTHRCPTDVAICKA